MEVLRDDDCWHRECLQKLHLLQSFAHFRLTVVRELTYDASKLCANYVRVLTFLARWLWPFSSCCVGTWAWRNDLAKYNTLPHEVKAASIPMHSISSSNEEVRPRNQRVGESDDTKNTFYLDFIGAVFSRICARPGFQPCCRGALEKFLADFPGHQKENEARVILKAMQGRDIVDLLKKKKWKFKRREAGFKMSL